jgi:hypothetical protein
MGEKADSPVGGSMIVLRRVMAVPVHDGPKGRTRPHRVADDILSILLICRESLLEIYYASGIMVRCDTDAGKIYPYR